MISNFIHRYLDPGDSLGELLFGQIMALTITLGARVLSQRDEIQAHDIVWAVIGCNIAWGVIDAVLYLLGSLFSRNRRVHFARKLQLVGSEAEAMAAIREEFGLEDEPAMPQEDRAAFHRVALDILRHASTERAHLRWRDLRAAAVIVILVSATAIPGVLPFLVIGDGYLAVRLANLIQICLMFYIGFNWANHSGANPWRTGLVIVGLGIALVAMAVVLGG
jgi:VIT1/CCC1 family predicted Fe2+/Mn2+ transporter